VSSLESLTEDPVLPRQRRWPRWLDDGNNYHHFATHKDSKHQVNFEVLDNWCGELKRLFDQSDLATVSSLKNFLLQIANGTSVEFPSFLPLLS